MKKQITLLAGIALLGTAIFFSCKKTDSDEPVSGGYPEGSSTTATSAGGSTAGTTGSTGVPGSGTSTATTGLNFMRIDSVDMGGVVTNAGVNTQSTTASSWSYYQIQGQTTNTGSNNTYYSITLKFGATTPPPQGTYTVSTLFPPTGSNVFFELMDNYLVQWVGQSGTIQVDTIAGSNGKRKATFYAIPAMKGTGQIKNVSATLKTP